MRCARYASRNLREKTREDASSSRCEPRAELGRDGLHNSNASPTLVDFSWLVSLFFFDSEKKEESHLPRASEARSRFAVSNHAPAQRGRPRKQRGGARRSAQGAARRGGQRAFFLEKKEERGEKEGVEEERVL